MTSWPWVFVGQCSSKEVRISRANPAPIPELAPPALVRRAPSLQGRGALSGDMDDRVMGVYPDAHGGLWSLQDGRIGGHGAAGSDLETALVELEFLTKRPPGSDRIRLESHPHFAHFEQAPVVIPGVGLGDVKMQVAISGHPGVQREVAIAQRHEPVVIPAG
jgi:hypothetical protein